MSGKSRLEDGQHLTDAARAGVGRHCRHLCGAAVGALIDALGTGEVDQTELADLDLVPVLQRHLVDEVAVHVGAVEAARVADQRCLRGCGGTTRAAATPRCRRGRCRDFWCRPAVTKSVLSRKRRPRWGPVARSAVPIRAASALTAASSSALRPSPSASVRGRMVLVVSPLGLRSVVSIRRRGGSLEPAAPRRSCRRSCCRRGCRVRSWCNTACAVIS